MEPSVVLANERRGLRANILHREPLRHRGRRTALAASIVRNGSSVVCALIPSGLRHRGRRCGLGVRRHVHPIPSGWRGDRPGASAGVPSTSVDTGDEDDRVGFGVEPRYRAHLTIVECVRSDEALPQSRVEGRARAIPGWYELAWPQVERRRRNYVPSRDPSSCSTQSFRSPRTSPAP